MYKRTTIENIVLEGKKVNCKIYMNTKFKEKNNSSALNISKVLVIRRESVYKY